MNISLSALVKKKCSDLEKNVKLRTFPVACAFPKIGSFIQSIH